MKANLLSSLSIAVLAFAAVACASGPAAVPSPSAPPSSPSPAPSVPPKPSPSPSPQPSRGPVATGADAAARVLASDPRFAGIGPLLPDLIGQSAWYDVTESADGWTVTITVGWGDCPAGCIDRHTWAFPVSKDGTVGKAAEGGDDLPAGILPGPVAGEARLDITLVAGPTCPVETNPPDPNCAARPVVNATVAIRDANGNEVGRLVTDAKGHAAIALPAGVYVVEALPANGLMGTPAAVAIFVTPPGPATVTLSYDTGIR